MSNYAITERWVQRIHDPSVYQLSSRRCNVFADGDRIYSYGTHFEMARVVRDKRGEARFVLLNGDTYSMSTSRHQNELRSLLRHHCKVPVMIVPHRALSSAGIDFDSIEPVCIKPEGYAYTHHVDDEPPKAAIDVTIGKTEDTRYGGTISAWQIGFGAAEYRSSIVPNQPPDRALSDGDTIKVITTEGTRRQHVKQRDDGKWEWYTARHWLGDSVFLARRHGESRRVRWLSSFDKQETTPLYFLCQLPPCTAATIEEAEQALKPDTVVMAEAMGRTATRQGDIFGVPLPGLTLRELKAQGGIHARRYDAMAPMRAERKVDRIVAAASLDRDITLERRSRWQRGGSYGGSAPWGIRSSWNLTKKEARDRELRITTVERHRRARFAPYFERWLDEAESIGRPELVSLLGTSHTSTEVITLPDGTQYARGIMYHDPALMGEDRERDHIRQKLGDGKTWHVIVKNTVPTANTRRRRSTTTA